MWKNTKYRFLKGLKKDFKRDTGSWTGKLIITMSVLPILFYRFNTIRIKIPAEHISRILQAYPNIYM